VTVSHHLNAGQNRNVKIANKAFENADSFKYLRNAITNTILIHEEIRFILNSGLCGLVVRVPGYRTEMYCASCEVRTGFIYVM
jgi:hypothetical protein